MIGLGTIFFLAFLGTEGKYSSSHENEIFKLTVIHFNDFHARFEETSNVSGTCNSSTCIGGFSRLYTEIHKQKYSGKNVLILNAGDNFQGTFWFNIFGWRVTQHFLSKLPVDAYTLGEHEFDHKIEGLVPFLTKMDAPFVVSNIDTSLEPSILGKFSKSVILHKYGKNICIIGAIAKNASASWQVGCLKFLDEAESINREARKIREDCDIIIALTHCGLDLDIKIAKKIDPKINLIVGGDSHSLLYNGKAPGVDQPVAPYPVVVERENGRRILIVQASSYTKYLGNITITYGEKGKILGWNGQPIYLGHDKKQDPEINREIKEWKKRVNAYENSVIGKVQTDLLITNCRIGECNIGDFFADAMVDYYKCLADPHSWTYASIALLNSGDLRTSLLKGDITFNQLVACSPFQDTVDTGELPGFVLKSALEHSVEKTGGQFLQVSGLRFTVDLSKPIGSRIGNIKVLCQKCKTPVFEDFDAKKIYRIISLNFIFGGGNNYTMIKDNLRNYKIGPVDTDVFEPYIRKRSPIVQEVRGRIKIINSFLTK